MYKAMSYAALHLMVLVEQLGMHSTPLLIMVSRVR